MPQPDDDLAIEVLIDSALWSAQPEAEQVVQRAVAAAATAMSTKRAELAIVLSDDSAIRLLNRDWRGFDKATNVLSFPAPSQDHSGEPPHLGDIVIAYETVAAEAAAEGKRFADHLSHLAVHGFLHLLGHDHETDIEAEAMESLERRILAQLGVEDPYADRDPASAIERHA